MSKKKQKEIITAQWIWNDKQYRYVCSNCKHAPKTKTGWSQPLKVLESDYPCCQHCGAKMLSRSEHIPHATIIKGVN